MYYVLVNLKEIIVLKKINEYHIEIVDEENINLYILNLLDFSKNFVLENYHLFL